jgi:hypothetical protein
MMLIVLIVAAARNLALGCSAAWPRFTLTLGARCE